MMTPTKNEQGEWTCEHGTAMDVHCCNCHSGFLFHVDACVCEGIPYLYELRAIGKDGREMEWVGRVKTRNLQNDNRFPEVAHYGEVRAISIHSLLPPFPVRIVQLEPPVRLQPGASLNVKDFTEWQA